MTCGVAHMMVAEVGRMTSVTFQDEAFAMAKYKMSEFKLVEEQIEKHVHDCLHHAIGMLQRSTFKLFFLGFLQTSVQLNLQVSLLAIQRAAVGPAMRLPDELGIFPTLRSVNQQTVFSIILSCIMALKRTYEVCIVLQSAVRIYRKTRRQRIEYCNVEGVLKTFNSVRSNIILTVLAAIAFLNMVVYAVLKLWALFYCASGLWNVRLPNIRAGCVNLLTNHTR